MLYNILSYSGKVKMSMNSPQTDQQTINNLMIKKYCQDQNFLIKPGFRNPIEVNKLMR